MIDLPQSSLQTQSGTSCALQGVNETRGSRLISPVPDRLRVGGWE